MLQKMSCEVNGDTSDANKGANTFCSVALEALLKTLILDGPYGVGPLVLVAIWGTAAKNKNMGSNKQ